MYAYIRDPLELTRQDNPKGNNEYQNRIEAAHDSLVYKGLDGV